MQSPAEQLLEQVESMAGNGQEIPTEFNALACLESILNLIVFDRGYCSPAGFHDDDTFSGDDDELRKGMLVRLNLRVGP